ncbi:hypothetical protein [Devosia nitrariae]|nr:hypothetical protein [Devosia nitrariae]
MRSFVLGMVVVLGLGATAYAGPMPVLPELPPLPTDYVAVGQMDGFHAGIVGVVSVNSDAAGTIGLAVGATTMAADLLLGVEGLGLVTSDGTTSLEASVRIGVALSDTVAIFGQTGLGLDSEEGSFLGLGGSLDAAVSDTLTARVQYRYAHDLSGDPGRHAILSGLLFKF